MTFSGRKSSQHPWELNEFICLLQKHDVRSYLEIGARDGDTFHAVATALPKGSICVAVDLPDGRWGRRDSGGKLHSAAQAVGTTGRLAAVVIGNSSDTGTVDSVRRMGPYDAIFIDADHTYSGVAKDFRLYRPFANKLIAFHDIAGHGLCDKKTQAPVEVPRFWQEFNGAQTREIIAPGSKMGIGVLWV